MVLYSVTHSFVPGGKSRCREATPKSIVTCTGRDAHRRVVRISTRTGLIMHVVVLVPLPLIAGQKAIGGCSNGRMQQLCIVNLTSYTTTRLQDYAPARLCLN